MSFIAESEPSLCIPRVFNNITEQRIRKVFEEIALGKISRIDIVERKNEKGDAFKRVYIHFSKWFLSEDAQSARNKIISGKEIKIVYENPWFWKVSANKCIPQRTRPYIEFGDVDEFGRSLELRNELESRRPVPPNDRRPPHDRRPQKPQDYLKPKAKMPPKPPTVTKEFVPEVIPVPQVFEPMTPPGTPPRTPPRQNSYLDVDESIDNKLILNYGDVPAPVPKKRGKVHKKKIMFEIEEIVNGEGEEDDLYGDLVFDMETDDV